MFNVLNTSRVRRLLFGALTPPLLGGLAFWMPVFVSDLTNSTLQLKDLYGHTELLGITLLFAFAFMGIQSAIYSLLMEFFGRRIARHRWQLVGISIVLALLSIIVFIKGEMFSFFLFTSIAVGFLVGYVLSRTLPIESTIDHE